MCFGLIRHREHHPYRPRQCLPTPVPKVHFLPPPCTLLSRRSKGLWNSVSAWSIASVVTDCAGAARTWGTRSDCRNYYVRPLPMERSGQVYCCHLGCTWDPLCPPQAACWPRPTSHSALLSYLSRKIAWGIIRMVIVVISICLGVEIIYIIWYTIVFMIVGCK